MRFFSPWRILFFPALVARGQILGDVMLGQSELRGICFLLASPDDHSDHFENAFSLFYDSSCNNEV